MFLYTRQANVTKPSAVAVVYSAASDTGFGGYSVQCGVDLVAGNWSKQHMVSSSTLSELLAVKFVVLSMLNQLSALTVKLFTDNQNVTNIVSCGSAKAHLQAAALRYIMYVVTIGSPLN